MILLITAYLTFVVTTSAVNAYLIWKIQRVTSNILEADGFQATTNTKR